MMQVSDYLDAATDGLPSIQHDVALDTKPPALAAAAIAAELDQQDAPGRSGRLLSALIDYVIGRRGTRQVPAAEVKFANALRCYRTTGRAGGPRRQLSIDECSRIAHAAADTQFSGDPAEDWILVRTLLQASACDLLRAIAGEPSTFDY